jgi:hypothetical protein
MKNSNKKLKIRLLLTLVGVFLFALGTRASHIVGGEVWYQWVQGNTYQVNLNLYRDCGGLPASNTASVSYTGCGVNGSLTLALTGTPTTVTALCPTSAPLTSCNGGSLYSIQRITYSGTVTLPGACSFWVFSYEECCRPSLSNLSSPQNTDMYYKAILNNVAAPNNNSARFNTVPTTIIPSNATSQMVWSAYDTDGDSLVYMLTPALKGPGQQVVYLPPYSASQPFSVSLPTNIDSTTGTITVTPNSIQNPVVCVKVNEYRNGVLVGTVYRDLMVTVYSSSNNSLPVLSGINGTSSHSTTVCAGDTLSFSLQATDPNPSQSPTIQLFNTNTSAQFSMVPGTTNGNFTWVTDSSMIQPSPHHFSFSAVDNFCDFMGVQSTVIAVNVIACNSNDVWPGDANYDGVANAFDVLSIGQAFGDSGYVRANATLGWVAQPCSDWSNSLANGINHKHSDTDGNGVVGFSDTLAVQLNYGLSHPLRLSNNLMMPSADLQITASADTIGMAMPVELIVSISTPIDSVSGLAFRLVLDTALVKINQTTIDYVGTVLGTPNVNLIKVDKVIGSTGTIEVGLSRTDHQNISGTGQIVRIGIVTTDNVSGKVTLYMDPSDIDGVTAAGNPITLNPVGTEVVIDPAYTGVAESFEQLDYTVVPIPASQFVRVDFKTPVVDATYEIIGLRGNVVLQGRFSGEDQVLDISTLPKGFYQLRLSTEKGILIKKIIKI